MDGIEVVSDLRRSRISYGGLELVSDLRRWPKKYDGLEVRVEQGKEVQIPRGGLYYVSGPEGPGPNIPDDGLAKAGLKDSKRVCGVRPTVFWLLLVIAVLIVVIAAVGGGVGGSYLANRDDSPDPKTPGSNTTSAMSIVTRTSDGGSFKTTFQPKTDSSMSITPISDSDSSSEGPTTSTTTTISSDSGATITTASKTSSAAVTSGTSGVASNPCPGQNLTTLTGSDGSIFTLLCAVDWPRGIKTAYGNGKVSDLTRSTEYTLKSCISQCVQWNTENDEKCKGVTYLANLTAAYGGGQDGNCFLKNSVGRYYPNSDTSMAAGILGG
ncbi:hypothetical protein N7491_001036 [Penicillium cf. griseofulvum]|uniref:Apple domain-containing protein n=1 Tax=Penicillium cf. griseofulvum TaxID=2972120 RepID=A0A9W9M900_9EURO|nr:hypothetical protein N7472_006171 [Penicillium cf. griseofulvum]KAJ5444954.1 hypothetical protein N7491_001036 [Penicillium cf. griseofulvum]